LENALGLASAFSSGNSFGAGNRKIIVLRAWRIWNITAIQSSLKNKLDQITPINETHPNSLLREVRRSRIFRRHLEEAFEGNGHKQTVINRSLIWDHTLPHAQTNPPGR
jgi:hypothetical protein